MKEGMVKLRVERESLYFEPRCISGIGSLHWYGGVYLNTELLKHTEETVYIRDDGTYLYIYQIVNQPIKEMGAIQINCQFELIATLEKHVKNKCYGKVLGK